MSDKTILKSHSILTEGRLRVIEANDLYASFTVQGGNKAPYVVAVSSSTGYSCTCPARVECAHILAAKLVCGISPTRDIEIGSSQTRQQLIDSL